MRDLKGGARRLSALFSLIILGKIYTARSLLAVDPTLILKALCRPAENSLHVQTPRTAAPDADHLHSEPF